MKPIVLLHTQSHIAVMTHLIIDSDTQLVMIGDFNRAFKEVKEPIPLGVRIADVILHEVEKQYEKTVDVKNIIMRKGEVSYPKPTNVTNKIHIKCLQKSKFMQTTRRGSRNS